MNTSVHHNVSSRYDPADVASGAASAPITSEAEASRSTTRAVFARAVMVLQRALGLSAMLVAGTAAGQLTPPKPLQPLAPKQEGGLLQPVDRAPQGDAQPLPPERRAITKPPLGASRAAPPPPASTISVTCPAHANEAGSSSRVPGWSFDWAWAPYMGLDVVNPASMNAGASLQCLYGYPRQSASYPQHLLTLRKSAGAGVTASMCTVSGNTVNCKGIAPITCPSPGGEIGPSRAGTPWQFLTAWPGRFLRAQVKDPQSMNAGTSVQCVYGPEAPGSRPEVIVTLSRSAGAGISADKCRMAPAQATITCSR